MYGDALQQQETETGSNRSCYICIDGVPLALPLEVGERCVSFLPLLGSSSRASISLAAEGLETDFTAGIVGFLGDLKETLRVVDDLWREAEERIDQALFHACSQHLQPLARLLVRDREKERQEDTRRQR